MKEKLRQRIFTLQVYFAIFGQAYQFLQLVQLRCNDLCSTAFYNVFATHNGRRYCRRSNCMCGDL